MYEVTVPGCIDIIDLFDFILAPLYIIVILFIALNYQKKKESENPLYRYFIGGLLAKIFGGIGFLLIYIYYYGSDSDTTMYYNTSVSLINLAGKNMSVFFSIIFGNNSLENYSYFNNETGYPYFYSDANSLAVARLTAPFVLIGARSFMATTVLISTLTYFGIWRLFLLFAEQNKEIVKQIAFAILFIPSVFFWGSGILKDSYTLSAICWLMVAVYYVVIKKKRIVFHLIVFLISVYVLIAIKPYIFFAAFGGIIIMVVHYFIRDVENKVLKYTVLPILIIVFVFGGIYVMLNVGNTIGGWYSSVDKIVEKAYITQQDLKQEYYGGNRFDIGSFDPTIGGILSKAQPAITAGLFRPFVWESRNPVMLLSGLENIIYLFLFLYILLLSFMALFNLGFNYMLKTAFDNSLVVFSLVFSIMFAFMVGLTTANFGALVRYKIPLIPFFLSALFIIISRFNKQRAKNIID